MAGRRLRRLPILTARTGQSNGNKLTKATAEKATGRLGGSTALSPAALSGRSQQVEADAYNPYCWEAADCFSSIGSDLLVAAALHSRVRDFRRLSL